LTHPPGVIPATDPIPSTILTISCVVTGSNGLGNDILVGVAIFSGSAELTTGATAFGFCGAVVIERTGIVGKEEIVAIVVVELVDVLVDVLVVPA
jgi:hypothetical protein